MFLVSFRPRSFVGSIPIVASFFLATTWEPIMSLPSSSPRHSWIPFMRNWMFLASIWLTLCLLVLPLSSASVVSSHASPWTVKSLSEKGIERRIHRQPLHLLPGTTAFVGVSPAGAAEVVKKGLMEAVNNGWSQVVTTVGFVLAFIVLLGEKLASNNTANKVELASEMKLNKVELATSIDRLASDTNLRIGMLELSIDKLTVKLTASMDKLTASMDKLSEKIEASFDKLSDEMIALRSHTTTSIAAQGAETKVSMREHTSEMKDKFSELNGKIEAIRYSTDARLSILEANQCNHHKKMESKDTEVAKSGNGSVDVPRTNGEAEKLTDTRDVQVKPDA